MSAARSTPRLRRAVLGAVLVVAAACLLSWAAFHVARGPSECGGDAGDCPPGFASALLGGVAALVVLGPIGIALLARRRGLPGTGLALLLGAVATGTYVARFEAAPVTDATLATWIVVGAFGVPAVLALLAGLAAATLPGPRAAAPRAAPSRVAPPDRDAPTQLHALLVHGLATGALGRDGASSDGVPATAQVAQLLDLHRRGVVDDEQLRDALTALRRRG
ncbi:hypothetical protein SK069_04295 [Patulibacter brassicae]|uniref:SHOCT domain-containing protein n=1 Tax=Patulibacter brassicae TaxID=1705717 RepID=A0ABU4VG58_9ACTN|nr:hypothetical protein [Patulibacter brassicae]MDX8150805.1 hypothetical protein [Patulibacter brassicae]